MADTSPDVIQTVANLRCHMLPDLKSHVIGPSVVGSCFRPHTTEQAEHFPATAIHEEMLAVRPRASDESDEVQHRQRRREKLSGGSGEGGVFSVLVLGWVGGVWVHILAVLAKFVVVIGWFLALRAVGRKSLGVYFSVGGFGEGSEAHSVDFVLFLNVDFN